MPSFFDTLKPTFRKLGRTFSTWGRVNDRSFWSNAQPDSNPDPIDDNNGERYFRISLNPYVKAGLNYRDVSRLFVSASGLEPDESGAYFPPQLIYTRPESGSEEQLNALAYQYDEQFDGGFADILRSLHQPAMIYGRAIGEIDWKKIDGKMIARFIWSRDPEEFIINPPDMKPGIYKKKHAYSSGISRDLELMPPGKFMHIAFDSLFNNPYGTSVTRPIADLTETWDKVYDAWRMGLIKSGYGSWLGTYGNDINGQGDTPKQARAQFLEQVKLIANGTASVFHESNNIRAEKLQLEAQAFLDFHTAYVQAVSVLMTGSSTALIEGKFGSFAKEESTTTRQKSDKEQADALLMGNAFTYQFNRYWLTYNYANFDAVPQLQLIRPELIMPTTPQGQDTQDEVEKETINIQTDEKDGEDEPTELMSGAVELQEDDEDKPQAPRKFDTFPSDAEEPEIYKDVEDGARAYLENLPIKNYNDVTPRESADVFTVKRLRNYEDAEAIQDALKDELIKTIGLENEAAAWTQYITAARNIFQRLGLDLSSSLQSDLIISFRQARQSAYQAGIDQLIDENPEGLTGIETVTMEDDRVRPVHALWNGVVLAPDDPRRERLRKPMDFGCRCNDIPVYNNQKPLTPENEIPDIFPGESYRGYVA